MRVEKIGDATLYLGDCGNILPTLSPHDAMVTDPPYGIGEADGKNISRRGLARARDYGHDDWDDSPISDDLMMVAIRSAKWAIIFGGNYYSMPPSSCWLVWDKCNGANDFADCELAWTNLKKAVRLIRFPWSGFIMGGGEKRGDHPTQKPVTVMTWALNHLPLGVHTVVDPFMGSGTTGVSCARLGCSFTGIEKEQKYFDAACRRIEAEYRQPRMRFDRAPFSAEQMALPCASS